MNSGRITGIRKGIYGGCAAIAEASASELDALHAEHGGPAASTAATIATPPDGTSDAILRATC